MAQTKKKSKNTQVEVTAEDDSGTQPSTVRLPPNVWDALDKDAQRCKRNRSRQLEALLEALYFGVDTGVPPDKLQKMAKASSFKLVDSDKAEPKEDHRPEEYEDLN